VKFTARGGVTLSAHYRDGRLYSEVVDSGAGMTDEELTQVFHPFVQVGAEEMRAQGTGLGLAISRRLVEAMGGVLAVESEPGRGSRFYFDIPAEAVMEGPVQAEGVATVDDVVGYRRLLGEGRLQLLLVDDRPENLKSLRELLEPLGFEIKEARSGEACLASVANVLPDAVLLDLRMPNMDGKECARRLRALPGTEELVIVAVSASAFREEVEEAIAAGCDAHIAKPVMLRELLSVLEKYLPLEWVRREPAVGKAKADGRSLTADERNQLVGTIRKGDILKVQQILSALVEQAVPPCGAAEMADAARRFDLKRVKRILMEMGNEG